MTSDTPPVASPTADTASEPFPTAAMLLAEAPRLPESVVRSLGRPLEEALGLAISYSLLIAETNRQFNLTAIRQPREIFEKLVLESWAYLPELMAHSRNLGRSNGGPDAPPMPLNLLDIGSGSGIPGIPLAIAQPSWRVACLEATRKKAEFIERAARTLGLDGVRVLNARSEQLAHQREHRERYDAAVLRLVGSMPECCELGLPFLRPMAWLLVSRFTRAEAEKDATDATKAARELGGDTVEIRLAPFDRHLLAVQKVNGTPRRYPRLPGTPKSRPLR